MTSKIVGNVVDNSVKASKIDKKSLKTKNGAINMSLKKMSL